MGSGDILIMESSQLNLKTKFNFSVAEFMHNMLALCAEIHKSYIKSQEVERNYSRAPKSLCYVVVNEINRFGFYVFAVSS